MYALSKINYRQTGHLIFAKNCACAIEHWLFLLLDEVPDNEEKPKGTEPVDVGPGSADCLALHQKGLYVAGQVCLDQTTSSLY